MRIFTILFLWTLTLQSCIDMPSDKALDSWMKTKILSGADRLIMKEITDFKWDSLLILRPYSMPDRTEDDLDINLSMIKYTGIDFGDNTNVLVYLYQGEVVNMVDFDRYPGDFSKNDPELISKSKAVFEITITGQKNINGDKWIEIVAVK